MSGETEPSTGSGAERTNTADLTMVALAHRPTGVAVTPDGSRVYLTVLDLHPDGLDFGGVTVVETATDTVTATLDLGRNPRGIAISPDGGRVYVPSVDPLRGESVLNTIDTATDTVVARVVLGRHTTPPTGVALSPDGALAYVVTVPGPGRSSGALHVVDTATGTVADRIAVGLDPFGITVTPDGRRAYVSISGDDGVEVDLSTRTVTRRLGFPFSSEFRTAVTADGARAYVVRTDNTDVFAVDLATLQAAGSAETTGLTTDVAMAPDGRRAYVTQRQGESAAQNLIAIDTATDRVAESPVRWSGDASALAIAPDGTRAYVADHHADQLVVIPLPLPPQP